MNKKCKSDNCYYLHKSAKKYEYKTRNEAEYALKQINYKLALKLV